MKKTLLILSIALCGIANAQAPNWAWAKSAGGTSYDGGNSVSTDAGGNVFVTGRFQSSSITFGTTTLTNADTSGGADIFIVKYDQNGNVLWAKSAGGTGWDEGFSCTIDTANGNIIITGFFNSPSITFGSTTLTNAGMNDIFIVKYGPSGNVLWVQSVGGTGDDVGLNCSIDVSSNIIVTGYFSSPSITFATTTLINAMSDWADMFIVKYDPNGNVQWVQSAGGIDYDKGWSCSTDANGNIIATGSFESSSITFGTTTLNKAGWADMFIVKYDPSGNVLWAKRAGGGSYDTGNSTCSDANGNIIVTGYFNSSSITFSSTTLTNTASSTMEIFIVKYDSNGSVLWAKSAGGIFNDWGYYCTPDGNGNIIVTGYFDSPSITFGSTALTNAGGDDIYVVKYDSNGSVLWAKSAGGNSVERGYSCTTDANENIIATGLFASSTLVFGIDTLTNAGNYDMFIAKLDSVLTGIESPLTTENEISIYPNPTDGKFVVQITNQYRFTDYELEIYNVLGEKVTRSVIPSPATSGINSARNLTLDLSQQPNGIYFLTIKTEQGRVTKKLIIQK